MCDRRHRPARVGRRGGNLFGAAIIFVATTRTLEAWMRRAAIAVLVLGFNFLGDGLRDALDPAMTGRR